jgi:hypothetical protein
VSWEESASACPSDYAITWFKRSNELPGLRWDDMRLIQELREWLRRYS